MTDTRKPDPLAAMTGLTSREVEEVFRLRETLGAERWEEIRRTHWAEYQNTHTPQPEPPYFPGLWRDFLETLRAAVRH